MTHDPVRAGGFWVEEAVGIEQVGASLMLLHLSLACAAYGVALLIGASYVRLSASAWRYAAMLGAQVCALSMPLYLPVGYPFTRFVLTAVAVLSVLRLWETARRLAADTTAYSSIRNYLLYYVALADVVFLKGKQHSAAYRREGWRRVGRALVKLVALLGLLASDVVLQLRDVGGPVETAWDLMAAYTASTSFTDCYTGLVMALSGQRCLEVFHSPPVARSPADFWGRRWNSTFRNASHRLIFAPLSRHLPVRMAMFCVFLWSAAVHEYIVWGSLGFSQGHMTAFFVLQGLAVAAQRSLRRRSRKRRMATWLAVSLHWAWMLSTAPLFFVPMKLIFLSDGNPLEAILK